MHPPPNLPWSPPRRNDPARILSRLLSIGSVDIALSSRRVAINSEGLKFPIDLRSGGASARVIFASGIFQVFCLTGPCISVAWRNKVRQQSGFSLIELLIVVAIILVIAAIAIPNLLSSRIAANEASAVASMRTINTAQVTYSSTYPDVGYAAALSALGPGSGIVSSSSAGLLDELLAPATGFSLKHGYHFTMTGGGTAYVTNALAIHHGTTGNRSFYSDASAIIRVNASGYAPAVTDPALQ